MLVARLTCLRSVPLVGLRPVFSQGSSALRSPILKACPPLLRPQQVLETPAFTFDREKQRHSYTTAHSHSLAVLVLIETVAFVNASLAGCVTLVVFLWSGIFSQGQIWFPSWKVCQRSNQRSCFRASHRDFY